MAKKKTIKKTTVIEEEVIVGTHIIAVLDRSGSMASIIDDSIGGFNTFINEQKEIEGDAYLTTLVFDSQFDFIHKEMDIKEVSEITRKEWSPRGSTSLNDAIGLAINNAADQNYEKTLMVIVTDGHENSSKEFTTGQIKDLISKKEKEDWEFVYLGANQDAFAVGGQYGFAMGNVSNYTADTDGVKMSFDTVSASAASFRSLSTNDVDYEKKRKKLVDNKED